MTWDDAINLAVRLYRYSDNTNEITYTMNIKMASQFDTETMLWQFLHMIVQITNLSALLTH
jgi:hypothetical protein